MSARIVQTRSPDDEAELFDSSGDDSDSLHLLHYIITVVIHRVLMMSVPAAFLTVFLVSDFVICGVLSS